MERTINWVYREDRLTFLSQILPVRQSCSIELLGHAEMCWNYMTLNRLSWGWSQCCESHATSSVLLNKITLSQDFDVCASTDGTLAMWLGLHTVRRRLVSDFPALESACSRSCLWWRGILAGASRPLLVSDLCIQPVSESLRKSLAVIPRTDVRPGPGATSNSSRWSFCS